MDLELKQITDKLLQFIDASPTCFHSVENVRKTLEEKGFVFLAEGESVKRTKYNKFYFIRNDSSLIAFQIENFVTSNDEKEELNEVVSMQLSVEELFLQVEREDQFDRGYEKVMDGIISRMLAKSMDDESIMEFTNCSFKHLQELKKKNLTGN